MKKICLIGLVLAVAAPALPAAQATNAPTRTDFSSFRIVSERNIFNASRSGQRPRRGGQQRVVRTDAFKLLGTMSYEKGRFAIFGGTSAQFRKIVKPAEAIAEYKLADVGPNSVKITGTNGHVIEMKVGAQMKRQDNGPWSLSSTTTEPIPAETSTGSATATSASATTTTTTTDSAPSASSGAENDVLKRLMQKREQELKK